MLKPIVSIIDIITSMEKLFPRIFSAPSLSFLPILIAAIGAPPLPISALNADIRVIIGNATPIPAMARSPLSSLPINILSTIL